MEIMVLGVIQWVQLSSGKNKKGFVDGSTKKSSSNDEKIVPWKRCKNIVLSWILNSSEIELANSVIAKSAAEIWEDLKKRF